MELGYGLIALRIRGLDVAVLLESLSEKYSTALKRIWHGETQINAVFVRDELVLRTMSEQAVVVVLEHDITSNVCEVRCLATAGGSGFLRVSYGSHDAAESTFQKLVEQLALFRGWEYEVLPPESVGETARCPTCGATYSYPRDKILKDGTVRCQNCDKPFILG